MNCISKLHLASPRALASFPRLPDVTFPGAVSPRLLPPELVLGSSIPPPAEICLAGLYRDQRLSSQKWQGHLLLWTEEEAQNKNKKIWGGGRGNLSRNSRKFTYPVGLLGNNPSSSTNSPQVLGTAVFRAVEVFEYSPGRLCETYYLIVSLFISYINYPSWVYFLQKVFHILPIKTCNPLKIPEIVSEYSQAPKYIEGQQTTSLILLN